MQIWQKAALNGKREAGVKVKDLATRLKCCSFAGQAAPRSDMASVQQPLLHNNILGQRVPLLQPIHLAGRPPCSCGILSNREG